MLDINQFVGGKSILFVYLVKNVILIMKQRLMQNHLREINYENYQYCCAAVALSSSHLVCSRNR